MYLGIQRLGFTPEINGRSVYGEYVFRKSHFTRHLLRKFTQENVVSVANHLYYPSVIFKILAQTMHLAKDQKYGVHGCYPPR